MEEWLEREIGVKLNVKEPFRINLKNRKVWSRRRTLC
jgi:hypothetical protein